uniref:ATP synthase F0 subunit 8 n=1 Tax=Centrotypus assamensis TaxID=3038120 RepID=UPI00315D34A1
MPQMAPMWWLSIMLTFNTMMVMLMCMMYFNKKMMMKKTNNWSKSKINWKW